MAAVGSHEEVKENNHLHPAQAIGAADLAARAVVVGRIDAGRRRRGAATREGDVARRRTLQLAAAVASMRGGAGLNPINALRQAVGLDWLRILPADATTGQRTAVAAGKYISRRAFVEIITDGAGYSATRAEFQVTRWLSILSTLSSVGRQSAAIRVSKDY